MKIPRTFLLFFLAITVSQNVRGQLPEKTAVGKNGMVITSQGEASRVGLEILRKGGNAIDAAVAVGYALAVTEPCCGNLGGGGFMLIRLANGESVFINFRETAPLAATANMYLDRNGEIIPGRSRNGYLGWRFLVQCEVWIWPYRNTVHARVNKSSLQRSPLLDRDLSWGQEI